MYPHFVVAVTKTFANVVVYLVTRGRRLLLEGRWRRGRYTNWSGDRSHATTVERPTSEAELAALLRGPAPIRVVGAGHSFNDGLASSGTTVSLDDLAGVIEIDHDAKQVTAWAGTRLRQLTAELLDEGLAIASLASHDAQSLAGILATDVHGTGSDPAHFSDHVVGLRLMDADGVNHDLAPTDDRYRAAVGGIGAVGIITRVTVQCVDAFDLRKTTTVRERDWVRDELPRLLREHDHVSFYAYPSADVVHLHTWTRTTAPRSRFGRTRERLDEAMAAVGAAAIGDALAYFGLLPRFGDTALRRQGTSDLVLPSHEAFSRSQYHLHQELEVAVPMARWWDDLVHLLQLYEQMSEDRRLPFLLVEVRFSPGAHDRSLLGAGVDGPTAWLCLCLNQSGDVAAYFDEVERWVRATGARVHLGKWCETLDADDLRRMHGARFDRFQLVRATIDPEGRFTNAFVRRVLGPVAAA